ncbi:ROK family glucokinase [Virgibacillus soli]|uniref:Glucokinase n=1 Tax=Paracerasibacillus soli TaxID=480284 RepID=A0ABU5CPZ6_9BACI|nr:ROK family glucokinase [Virgibacillus soli]MDY0408438.1 ROK family glucokinase [Virgibacillus soli]
MMEKYNLGIDIGGTAVKIGIVTIDGKIVHKWEIPTNKTEQGKHIVKEVWESISTFMHNNSIPLNTIQGMGIGAPGFVNREAGIIYEAVNIGWKNFDLAAQFKTISNLPVFVENDANMAALGEFWRGAGDLAPNMIAITLGTGVGGGVIANGTLLDGVNGTAGEIGHLTVDPNGYLCNCGRHGCLETVASATGIVRQAYETAKKHPSGQINQFIQENKTITTKDIFHLASLGDEDANEIIMYTADVLGLAIANIATVINPEKVLLGGGVSKAGNQFIEPLKKAFKKYALSRISAACEFSIAKLGNDAGIIGASYLVNEKCNANRK